jgi:hypothetical protein
LLDLVSFYCNLYMKLVTNNIAVNNGVGQDIWKVPFDSITKFLLVSLP